jgi:hypothetical protein
MKVLTTRRTTQISYKCKFFLKKTKNKKTKNKNKNKNKNKIKNKNKNIKTDEYRTDKEVLRK